MKYGIALDIGTTEICGLIADTEKGAELGRCREQNDQKVAGSDVMSRLDFALKTPDGGRIMKDLVLSAVDRAIKALLRDSGASSGDVARVIAVGNSAMHHLLLSLDIETLARAPFLPSKIESSGIPAGQAGVKAVPEALFRFMPNISGFVGSDALAAIMASGLNEGEETTLLMDIGTNGEIALGSRDKTLAASCASGPAFAGWHIKCGMGAVDGAIEGASLGGGELKLETIGGGRPRGICGSGLVDIAALMLERRAMDKSGRLKFGPFPVYADDSVKIEVTQEDVRQLQLAKAAFAAGIDMLKRRIGRPIESVVVTGTFGSRMKRESAQKIGLLPSGIDPGRVAIMKNGALEGAKKMLLDTDLDALTTRTMKMIEHVPLHSQAEFNDLFTSAMGFEERAV